MSWGFLKVLAFVLWILILPAQLVLAQSEDSSSHQPSQLTQGRQNPIQSRLPSTSHLATNSSPTDASMFPRLNPPHANSHFGLLPQAHGHGGERLSQPHRRSIATTESIRGQEQASCFGPFPPSLPGRLESYRGVSAICEGADHVRRIALRSLETQGRRYLLTVHPVTLTTQFELEACLRCQSAMRNMWRNTPYGQALETSLSVGDRHQGRLNLGLTRSLVAVRGSFLTADLCPSRAPFDREAIQRIINEAGQLPIRMGLAYSGLWLQRHPNEFRWLRLLELQGRLQIEWINHSYSHPYRRGVDLRENFLLTEGVDLYREIFLAEKQLIEMGGRPSVFFRFPGLVGDAQLLQRIGDYGLIALGSEAWLAKGQRPRDGSLILLHANGNEPAGWRAFDRLWRAQAIPLPFRDLRELVHPSHNE